MGYTEGKLTEIEFSRTIVIVDEKLTETWDSQINRDRVTEVLSNFKKVDEGWMPQLPKPWQCKSCEFKDVCKLYNVK